MRPIRPQIRPDGVPECSLVHCPAYDGKRCEVLGHRPQQLCEPAVVEIARKLQTFEARERAGKETR